MVFTKMQQIAAIPEICAMKTIAYFIDPLVEQSSYGIETGFLEALLALFTRLPEYRHVLVTSFDDITWDEEPAEKPELITLKLGSGIFSSRTTRLRKALDNWLQQENPAVFVGFDSVWPKSYSGKSLLIAQASQLLQENGKPWKKAPNPLPSWQNASLISLPFQSDRDELLRFLPSLESRVCVFYPALQPDIENYSWSEKETLKIRHSGGREYFMYMGPLEPGEELIKLLKSFSLLKKWLMTGMPFILAGPSTEDTPRLKKLLETYKYRADVTVLEDLDPVELKPLLSGAYLLAYPYKSGAATWPLEWGIQAATSVITTAHPHTREICGEAASYAEAGDIDAWAHQMMVLYKDEQLRSRLVENAVDRRQQMNQNASLDTYATMIRQLSS
jgi:glycosyltransferase involved in cell wall biosynthesis